MKKDCVQLFEPIKKRWVKVSTLTGAIIAIKKTNGPWRNVKMSDKQEKIIEAYSASLHSKIDWFQILIKNTTIADGFSTKLDAQKWLARFN